MKRFAIRVVAFLLSFSFVAVIMAKIVPYNVFEVDAAAITQADIQKIKDKIAANENKIKQNESKLKDLQNNIENYLDIVEELQNKISNLEGTISDTVELINKYEDLIAQTKVQIYERENHINAKYDDFLEIIKKNFENGNQSYLEILFDSKGFADFLSRADRLGSIISYEQTVLASLEKEIEDLKILNETLNEAKQQTITLENYQSNAENELKNSLKEAEAQLKKLQSDEAALKKVQQQAANLDKQLDKELEEAIKKYQQQQTDEINAKLLWPVDPVNKRISSVYGWRMLWGEKDFHLGIDIVGPKKGSIAGANIYASADGTVLTAKYNNSYGYYILIDHGNKISTLYAHCSKLLVKAGDRVHRGQLIGYVGLTGNTNGYHLHYEVRYNGSTTNPLDKSGNGKESWLVMMHNGQYVDPVKNKLLTYD
jgi:murein DD-endopeptidase MepM/ murein hydrolase activator NlpD